METIIPSLLTSTKYLIISTVNYTIILILINISSVIVYTILCSVKESVDNHQSFIMKRKEIFLSYLVLSDQTFYYLKCVTRFKFSISEPTLFHS